MTNNQSMKISGGGAFNVVATNANIFTTNANEYAKVLLRGTYFHLASGTGQILVGGVSVAEASASSGTTKSFHNEQQIDISGAQSGVENFEILVPPSTIFSCIFPPSGAGIIQGTYVKFANT
jgi:hypothetical protein